MAKNGVRLGFVVPEARYRPGDTADFAYLKIPPAGMTPRPPPSAAPSQTRDLAFGMVRVLDEKHHAVGPWNPGLTPETLVRGLSIMLQTRIFDDRMFKAQRQGKTPFYLKCSGEEAIAAAQAMALDNNDMCFPTYRQQGLLFARGWPMLDLMCQIYLNRNDRLKGRQLPILHSVRKAGFFSLAGNLGNQFPQAVGWAMASAYSGDHRIAAAWIGEGASAEGDFHHAMVFASVYHAPVILNLVNNQWAISSTQAVAGGEEASFASRAIGFGFPGIRVDGNDFLAVTAVTRWAAERARANLGPTLIEHFTYRSGAHSTSDDPGRYRPADEYLHWPLGDPVERLKAHLMTIGAWDEPRHAELVVAIESEVDAANREAQEIGVHSEGPHHDAATMFEDVYAEMPPHLREQLAEMQRLRALAGRGPP